MSTSLITILSNCYWIYLFIQQHLPMCILCHQHCSGCYWGSIQKLTEYKFHHRIILSQFIVIILIKNLSQCNNVILVQRIPGSITIFWGWLRCLSLPVPRMKQSSLFSSLLLLFFLFIDLAVKNSATYMTLYSYVFSNH